jgi:hypothetical protein
LRSKHEAERRRGQRPALCDRGQAKPDRPFALGRALLALPFTVRGIVLLLGCNEVPKFSKMTPRLHEGAPVAIHAVNGG